MTTDNLKTLPHCEKHPRYSTHPFCPDCRREVEAERKEQDSNLKTWPERAYICQENGSTVYDELKEQLLFFGNHSEFRNETVEYTRADIVNERIEAAVKAALEAAAKEPRKYAMSLEESGYNKRFPEELTFLFNASTNIGDRIRNLDRATILKGVKMNEQELINWGAEVTNLRAVELVRQGWSKEAALAQARKEYEESIQNDQ